MNMQMVHSAGSLRACTSKTWFVVLHIWLQLLQMGYTYCFFLLQYYGAGQALYTWGNGRYGRLGCGTDANKVQHAVHFCAVLLQPLTAIQASPSLVELLRDEKVSQASPIHDLDPSHYHNPTPDSQPKSIDRDTTSTQHKAFKITHQFS